MRQSIGGLVFSGTGGTRGNLFADLSRVVIEGSHGVGKKVERQDEGSRTDFKNLCARYSCRSARLGTEAQ